MKSFSIGSIKYPIILTDSICSLDPGANAIQCIADKTSGISAYFFQGGRRFNAWAENSTKAAELLSAKIMRYEGDRRTSKIKIGDRDFQVKSRNSLWDESLKSERQAPLEVVHWWTKGTDGDEYYKCDIHFLGNDGSSFSFEGMGANLNEALEDLASVCCD